MRTKLAVRRPWEAFEDGLAGCLQYASERRAFKHQRPTGDWGKDFEHCVPFITEQVMQLFHELFVFEGEEE